MKKKNSLFLAMLVLTPALYAQADTPLFTREQVLDVFSRFNPSVLEQARQNEDYRAILDNFLSRYQGKATPENEFELISVARNFDTSIRLDVLTKLYQGMWRYAKMSGTATAPIRQMFAQDLSEEMAHVWAVSVQLRRYQLAQAKAQLQALRRQKGATQTDAEQEARLQRSIRGLETEIKKLTQHPGEYVTNSIEHYIDAVDRETAKEMFTLSRQVAQEKEQTARASSNLQIKNKNKKPVAK